jgi:hypothetical protein
MAFMQPQITDKQYWWKGDAKDGGTQFAPYNDINGDTFKTDVLGIEVGDTPPEIVCGWGVRLSAPGYLDCTDWEVFEDHDEARVRYMELRDEDRDDESEGEE